MSRLLVRSHPPGSTGSTVTVTPESAGWRYVGMEVFRLEPSHDIRFKNTQREICIVVLSGGCRVQLDGSEWEDVTGRSSPFDGLPTSFYAPPGVEVTIDPRSTLEIAVATAPAQVGAQPRVIRPNEVEVERRGAGVLQRNVHKILMEDQPAESLLVVEVVVPGGHWAGYPAHKHDEQNLPKETYLEEIYYHRISRPEGFAIQRVYTKDRSLDETITVRDGDVVLVPCGYHPTCAGPGYDSYFLNAMAGPIRLWRFTTDPEQEWILNLTSAEPPTDRSDRI